MSKTKLITGVILVLAVLFSQVGTVFASPAAQETTPITGTIVEVIPETDESGVVTTVLVKYLDEAGLPQSVRVSVATAQDILGLISVNPDTQEVTILAQPNDPVSIDPALVIPDEEVEVHPIAAILAKFFDTDPVEVNDLHEDGFGFGLIAQAMWMQKNILENDLNIGTEAITAEMILQAKRNNDFSIFSLQDGDTTITVSNWGQFRKAVLDKKNNLGVIVSGQADSDVTEDDLIKKNNGHGKDNNPGKGKDKNKKP